MIKIVVRLLKNELPIGDPDIDFALGINKYPSNIKEAITIAKRKIKRAWHQTK